MPRFAKGRRSRQRPPICVDRFIGDPRGEDEPTSVDDFIGAPPSPPRNGGAGNYSDFLAYNGHSADFDEEERHAHAQHGQWKCATCSLGNDMVHVMCEGCGEERFAFAFERSRGVEAALAQIPGRIGAKRCEAATIEGEYVCNPFVEVDVEDDSGEESEAEFGDTRFAGDVLVPTFDSEGRFLSYEAHGSHGPDAEANVSRECIVGHGQKHAYKIAFAALIFVVALVLSIYYSTEDTKPRSNASLLDPARYHAANTVTDVAEPATKQHTHPQMHHDHTRNEPNPAPMPTRVPSAKQHTHPKKDHKWRHTNAPTVRHHTHAKKNHSPRGSGADLPDPATVRASMGTGVEGTSATVNPDSV